MVIESVMNFALTAVNMNAGATIKCTSSFGFYFRFTHNLTISGITFEECGAEMFQLSNARVTATILILISCSVTVDNVTITKGRGIGLLAFNPHGQFLLQDSTFVQNQLNFCLFKLPFHHTDFKCAISSQKRIVVQHSKLSGGYVKPNGTENYYHNFSSGITIITISSKDPSYTKIRIILVDVILYNNTGMAGNLYIEYNACQTAVYIDELNSSNSDVGVYIRPRLWRSTYCTIYTAWGTAIIARSLFNKTSLYLSVPQEDVISIDDFFEIDPILTYKHSVSLYNVTVVNSVANTTLFVAYIHQVLLADITFENNKGLDLMVLIGSEILFQGQCIFKRNVGGIAAYTHARLIFIENSSVQILETHDDLNAPLHMSYAYLEMQHHSMIRFENNTGLLSGAMACIGSIAFFLGTDIKMTFLNNKGTSGGALALYDKSRFDFHNNSEVYMTFVRNSASKVGGAIFVKDVEYLIKGSLGGNEPFFRMYGKVTAMFNFLENTADLAGCSIYGGWIDSVDTKRRPNITISTKDNCNASIVSSNPKRLCVCVNSQPDCNITHIQVEHIPGQPYFVSAVAVGQRFGIVPSTVLAQFIDEASTGVLDETQYVQIVIHS